jgi:RimJ/RimL family protein N-acetyltransferase
MSSTVSIETARLRLRPVRMDDLEELVRLHEDPEVARFMSSPGRDWLVERIEINEREWAKEGRGLLAIVKRDGGGFLGRAGLKHWPQFDEIEVGWVLHPEARGNGYATEAARACLEWGFESFDLPYITAMIRPDNTPSIAVAERLGMSPLRSDELLGAEVIVYAIGPEA